MIYRLKDGGFEFMDDHNRVGRLRELLREKLGEEIAECFDDVVADLTSDHEEAALEYIQKKLLHPLNIMNSMLADKDFSQTIPDAVKSCKLPSKPDSRVIIPGQRKTQFPDKCCRNSRTDPHTTSYNGSTFSMEKESILRRSAYGLQESAHTPFYQWNEQQGNRSDNR